MRTAIQIPMDGQGASPALLERLRAVVAADPRLALAPFHQRGTSGQNPWFAGWGPTGARHTWVLLAAESVRADEIREIGACLEEYRP